MDNAGYELVSDFLLGHILIETKTATEVVFHTKGHPTFVSDATTDDCLSTVNFLQEALDQDGNLYKETARFSSALAEYVRDGRFKFVDDLFWCQPTAFWDMPVDVQEKLQDSVLVVVKGDANYRRLLGEREWQLNTPARSVLSYWPVPVCALRTFKAEIGCGISSAQQSRARAEDSKWMVSGKWGVVQLGGV